MNQRYALLLELAGPESLKAGMRARGVSNLERVGDILETGFCRAWCGRDWQAIRAALCLVLLQTGSFKDMYEMP